MNLIYCDRCKLNSFVPLMDECSEAKNNSWLLVIRCTSCGREREGVVSQSVADKFDRALNEEAVKLRAILVRAERALMEDFSKRFTAALRADALLPEDFR